MIIMRFEMDTVELRKIIVNKQNEINKLEAILIVQTLYDAIDELDE